MKKIALILLTLIVGFAFVRADNPCTRYFAGNRGYVKVYYNRSDNKLEISSQTGMNIRHIAELQIKVTCTHKWQIRGIRERGTNRVISPAKWNEEQVTICDSRYTNIPVNKSISLSNGLADLPQDSNTDYFENFNVTISNPLLSSENEISTSENRVQENRTPSKSNENNATENTNPSFASSGGNLRNVTGSNNNKAYVRNSQVVSNQHKQVHVFIDFTNYEKRWTTVIVELYDGNAVEATQSKKIFSNSSSEILFNVREANHTYTARIVDASVE